MDRRSLVLSIKRGKGVIGIYKGDKAATSVPPAVQQNGCKTMKWEHGALMEAIEDASTKR